MSENINRETDFPNVRVMKLSGRLGVRVEQDLAATITREIDADDSPLLLDMAAVDFVSSSGLRALLLAYKHADSKGRKMAMTRLQPAVYKIFKLTASEDIMHIFDSVDNAMAWLNSK